jgi:hypothetical protein
VAFQSPFTEPEIRGDGIRGSKLSMEVFSLTLFSHEQWCIIGLSTFSMTEN